MSLTLEACANAITGRYDAGLTITTGAGTLFAGGSGNLDPSGTSSTWLLAVGQGSGAFEGLIADLSVHIDGDSWSSGPITGALTVA